MQPTTMAGITETVTEILEGEEENIPLSVSFFN